MNLTNENNPFDQAALVCESVIACISIFASLREAEGLADSTPQARELVLESYAAALVAGQMAAEA